MAVEGGDPGAGIQETKENTYMEDCDVDYGLNSGKRGKQEF